MIKIGFVQKDYKNILNAIKKMKAGVKKEIEDNLPLRCATKYRENVFEAILTQKYAKAEWAYNTDYNTWKYSKTGHSGGFWQLDGDLARALSVKKEKDGWFSGIQAGVYDSGNKSYGKSKIRSVAWYARVMEEGAVFQTRTGTQTHPKRPLFRPVLAEFQTIFEEQGNISLKNIAALWV